MPATVIRSYDDVAALLCDATRQDLPFYKMSTPDITANSIQSLWQVAGMPGAAATPATGTGETCSSGTAGAIPFTNAASGTRNLLANLQASCTYGGGWMLYDRLWQNSGLSGTVLTAQAVNSLALPRYTDGKGVEIWIEWYTTTGATLPTITCSYTNTAGVSGRTTVAQTAITGTAGTMMQLPLQGGDLGVLSVQSITVTAAASAAGNIGVTLGYPIQNFGISAVGQCDVRDPLKTGLVQVRDNACLALMCYTGLARTGVLQAKATLIEAALCRSRWRKYWGWRSARRSTLHRHLPPSSRQTTGVTTGRTAFYLLVGLSLSHRRVSHTTIRQRARYLCRLLRLVCVHDLFEATPTKA